MPARQRSRTPLASSPSVASPPPPIAPRSAYLESVSHGCFPTLRLCGRFARCSRLVVFLAAAAASESRARKFPRRNPIFALRRKERKSSRVKSSEISPPALHHPPSGAPPVVERRGSATENPQEAFWLVSRSRSRTSRGPTACPHSSLPVTGANPKPAPRLGRETSTAPAICFRCPC